MKIKTLRKYVFSFFLLVTSTIFLTSCSSDDSPSIQVMVANSYVNEEALTTCSDNLLAEHPSWQQEDLPVQFSSLSFGSPDTDPAMYGASTMKISAIVASGEMDILICDIENAARYARGDMFISINEIISEEKLSSYQERLLTFELMDDEGNPTGEYTEPCGISLNGNTQFDTIYGEQEYGIFLVTNADPIENAEQVFMDMIDA